MPAQAEAKPQIGIDHERLLPSERGEKAHKAMADVVTGLIERPESARALAQVFFARGQNEVRPQAAGFSIGNNHYDVHYKSNTSRNSGSVVTENELLVHRRDSEGIVLGYINLKSKFETGFRGIEVERFIDGELYVRGLSGKKASLNRVDTSDRIPEVLTDFYPEPPEPIKL